jgi:RimJ/RimL family protein N-acetyltransferase
VTATPPQRIQLDDSYVLRQFRIGDADALALAVRASLEHLRPWMPWADEESGDPTFQRRRLRGVQHKATAGDEWQYGLFPTDESRVLGSFGLMTRQGPRTIEIGYWVHVNEIGRGLATLASTALTNVSLELDGVTTVFIRCDERNVRSAAVPRRLGYELDETIVRAPEAPGESGRLMIWSRRAPIASTSGHPLAK